ncbi:Esterase B1, partial [Frankliniella fusca]
MLCRSFAISLPSHCRKFAIRRATKDHQVDPSPSGTGAYLFDNICATAPRPPTPWSGIRNATEETVEMCSQQVNGVFAGSEDCLYLNVYTPALPSQLQDFDLAGFHKIRFSLQTSKTPLPVYFFIHGGLFQGGSPSTEMYGPDFLVQKDIVVVTIQYRVNSLGFASFDTEEIPGNCALKDIIAALKWVQKNIAAFGGDPHKVTVGGQSAGGALASWITILPEAK